MGSSKHKVVLLTQSLLLLVLQVHGDFLYINVDVNGGSTINLTSAEFPVNTAKDWDVIWTFPHSILIETNSFSLDGQRGDFILVSDLPLLFADSITNDTGLPSDYGNLIASDSLTLMSWESNATSIQVLTKHGSFIHFHRERRVESTVGPPSEFHISVKNLDSQRIPSTTRPPETTVTTPQPNVEVYLTKFISCMKPEEFIKRKEHFKESVAEVASAYCMRTSGCMEIFDGTFLPEEVNVPDDGGLHYCDPLWPEYETCVEVTFAIVRSNASTWLMPKGRLNAMWEESEEELKAEGFCPFTPPPPLKHLNGFVWVASTIAFLLIVLVVLCASWIWNEPDGYGRHEDDKDAGEVKAEEIKPINEGTTGGGGHFYDPDNPVMDALYKIRKGNEDSRYLEFKAGGSQSSGYNTAIDHSSGNPLYGGGTQSKVKQNVLFQEQEVTFDFHNPAFQYDEEHEEEQQYGFDFRPDSADRSRTPNEFLSIERDFYDERSDTEI